MLGDGEGFFEVRNTSEGGALEPGADACLKYGKGVEIPIPCLEDFFPEGCG